jgi:hypothetical protein
MARIRSIKPELPQDAKLASVSRAARYHFVLLFTVADDEGFFRASPRLLLGQLYPHDEAEVGERELTRMHADLMGIGVVEIRPTPDGAIGWLVNWKKHQRVDRPSASFLRDLFDGASRAAREPGAAGVLSPESLVLSPESSSSSSADALASRLNGDEHGPVQPGSLVSRLANDVDREALSQVIARVPALSSRLGVTSLLLAILNGIESPQPTPVEMGRALRDYAANETGWNAAHFRAYLRRAIRAQRAPPPAIEGADPYDTPAIREMIAAEKASLPPTAA